MNGLNYLVLYVPIVVVILIVLETCRSDDPGRIVKRAFSNFGALTLVLAIGSAFVYVVNRYL
jgi:hypothetical protein